MTTWILSSAPHWHGNEPYEGPLFARNGVWVVPAEGGPFEHSMKRYRSPAAAKTLTGQPDRNRRRAPGGGYSHPKACVWVTKLGAVVVSSNTGCHAANLPVATMAETKFFTSNHEESGQ
jgi:hypothetical protein